MSTPRRPPSGRTADEDLLCCPPTRERLADADQVRLERITAEIETGFATLNGLGPAVSVFGSARTPADHPDYARARALARRLGDAGIATISGGGPGIMEATNRGARDSSRRSSPGQPIGETSQRCRLRKSTCRRNGPATVRWCGTSGGIA